MGTPLLSSFVVKRSGWYRGKGSIGSFLVLRSGEMDSLGFLGVACGIPKDYMMGAADPGFCAIWLWPDTLFDRDGAMSEVCINIIDINDSKELNDEEREAALIEQFKMIGIAVTFQD